MRKDKRINVILFGVFLAGLILLLYPTLADYWNSKTQSLAISGYVETMNAFNEEEYEELTEKARVYNQNILKWENPFVQPDEDFAEYQKLLNIADSGIMGFIDIPTIDVKLPIYHGTDDSVLQRGIGHLQWSSLPVGGESTHCVLSGHRGLPSARLFTDVSELVEGDWFSLSILNRTYTYEIDRILIVEPKDMKDMNIIEGEDYCTLVTCTPYGINTHRLLLRGHRVDTLDEMVMPRVEPDAFQLNPLPISLVLSVPVLLILTLIILIKPLFKKEPAKKAKNERNS